MHGVKKKNESSIPSCFPIGFSKARQGKARKEKERKGMERKGTHTGSQDIKREQEQRVTEQSI